MPIGWLRSAAALAAMTIALLLCTEDADARLEAALAVERPFAVPLSAAPAWSADAPAGVPDRTATLVHTSGGQQSGSLGGLFNRPGLLGGFAAGFLGSGVLGLLLGQGVIGGLNGAASYLGLMVQLALLGLFGRVIWLWWSGRNAPSFAGLSPRQLADPYLRSRNDLSPGDEIAEGAKIATEGDTKPASETAPAHGERQ